MASSGFVGGLDQSRITAQGYNASANTQVSPDNTQDNKNQSEQLKQLIASMQEFSSNWWTYWQGLYGIQKQGVAKTTEIYKGVSDGVVAMGKFGIDLNGSR